MDHHHHGMNHSAMGHGAMDHGAMDHGAMDHGGMDHGGMDHGGMDHGGMDHGGGMGHMMMMTFHFGVSETILFDFWQSSSTSGLIFSMVGIFMVAALYEGLKYFRYWGGVSLANLLPLH